MSSWEKYLFFFLRKLKLKHGFRYFRNIRISYIPRLFVLLFHLIWFHDSNSYSWVVNFSHSFYIIFFLLLKNKIKIFDKETYMILIKTSFDVFFWFFHFVSDFFFVEFFSRFGHNFCEFFWGTFWKDSLEKSFLQAIINFSDIFRTLWLKGSLRVERLFHHIYTI